MKPRDRTRAAVIGGTHGIGLAVTQRLLDRGAEVLVTGSEKRRVDEAREMLASPLAHVVQSDVADLGAIEQLAHTVETTLGSLDLLHLNAGFAELQTFERVTEEAYDRAFQINTKGTFFTVQRLAPLIADGGSIVFTTSIADEGGAPGMITYSGAKSAVLAFAKTLATELMPRGIRVNVVAPGFIDTPTMGVRNASDAERRAFQAIGDSTTPMGRHGTVDEVATAVMFLAFDATFTTGARLTVDGGLGSGVSNTDAA